MLCSNRLALAALYPIIEDIRRTTYMTSFGCYKLFDINIFFPLKRWHYDYLNMGSVTLISRWPLAAAPVAGHAEGQEIIADMGLNTYLSKDTKSLKILIF